MRILISGGCGFIGKAFMKVALDSGCIVHNIDSLTYAVNEDYHYDMFVNNEKYYKKYYFQRGDISDIERLPPCDILVHMAAESHVDNSIGENEGFLKTNIMGTRNLLEVVRRIQKYERPLFIQISSDEVVGDIIKGEHTEDSLLNPSSPYSSSKAASELLVKSWSRTYDIDYLIVRPSNNYGILQHPEKLIPKTIMRFNENKPAIIHGTGAYKRSWTHIDDTSRAILYLIERGYKNEIFNITTQYELTNLEVIKKIADAMEKEVKIEFVENRKGQDIRYFSSNKKLLSTGFKFKKNFDTEIKKIVLEPETNWYISLRR